MAKNENQSLHLMGGVAITHDGVLLASTLPHGADAEMIGVLCLGIHRNTTHTASKMRCSHVSQLACRTADGFLSITDWGDGIMAVFSNDGDIEELTVPLRREIEERYGRKQV